MNQTVRQREAYTLRRMGLAVDRFVGCASSDEKRRAKQWLKAWQLKRAKFMAAIKTGQVDKGAPDFRTVAEKSSPTATTKIS